MPTETPTREPELVAAESALMRQAAGKVTPAPVTDKQLDLVRRTVAIGATDAELKLFLYDCERRGVHPLDRLIHFTKTGGRYTPITSIDLLRTRAAETGEMAGSDDADFAGEGARLTATVTVYRLTRGVRYAYTATARFSEYCPPQGRDHMWRKMPHTMLAKCAEALALRKAFPQQLAGLYVAEELEQARPDFTTEATRVADQYAVPEPPEHEDARDDPEQPVTISADRAARLPLGVCLITRFVKTPTKNARVHRYTLTLTGGPSWPADMGTVTTINERLAELAESAWHREQPVKLTAKSGKFGYELTSIEDAAREPSPAPAAGPMPSAGDIPF